MSPSRGHSVAAVNRTEQCSGDCRIGVGVAAAHHCVAQAGDEAFGVQELEESVLQCNQHPALMRHEIIWNRNGSPLDALTH